MSEVICNKVHLTKTRVHRPGGELWATKSRFPLRADAHLTLPSARWDRVLRQAEVIRCLAECADDAGGRGSGCRVTAIDEAAPNWEVSRRTARRWTPWYGAVSFANLAHLVVTDAGDGRGEKHRGPTHSEV